MFECYLSKVAFATLIQSLSVMGNFFGRVQEREFSLQETFLNGCFSGLQATEIHLW